MVYITTYTAYLYQKHDNELIRMLSCKFIYISLLTYKPYYPDKNADNCKIFFTLA